MNHLETYLFSVGEIVTVGGNPNMLAEVMDISGEQLEVKVLTPPSQGKVLYTTRFTLYTTPMPHLTPEKVRAIVKERLGKNKEIDNDEEIKIATKSINETKEISVEMKEPQKKSVQTKKEPKQELVEAAPIIVFEEEIVLDLTSENNCEQLSLF